MNSFEKQQIQEAFDRCWGLQSALKDSENDALLRRGTLESLATQSGLRRSFIEDNLTEILAL